MFYRFILLPIMFFTLFGCAVDPAEMRRQEQAERQEASRQASLTPKQRCMEAADNDIKYCNVQCALGNVDGRNPGRYQQCSSSCKNQQLTAYQVCSYK